MSDLNADGKKALPVLHSYIADDGDPNACMCWRGVDHSPEEWDIPVGETERPDRYAKAKLPGDEGLKDLIYHFWLTTGQSQIRNMTPEQREVFADVIDELHNNGHESDPGPLERWWQMGTVDPTRIDLKADSWLDPTVRRMYGTAYHGNTPFDMPFITHVEGNLWQGGCENGLILPDHFEYVFSLYPWERYTIGDHVERVEVKMYDSADGEVDREQVIGIAQDVLDASKLGPTLVHCQAGLNRSGLIAAVALVLTGAEPVDAIALLRERRSPAVLCNPLFEKFVLGFND